MRTLARVTFALALAALGSARAQEACRADAERLCAGIPQGGGRIRACLTANEAQLTVECKTELASVAAKIREVGDACGDDVQSYCADVKPGQFAVLRCLGDNLWSLSPGCQDVIRSAREKAAEFEKACGKDAKAFCKGIRAGQGRILSCLESRRAELSPRCQDLMGPPPPQAPPQPRPQ